MQEIPATNSQNMNTTTDLPVKKVWIVRDDENYNSWDVHTDFDSAYGALSDKIVNNMPDYMKESYINDEYGNISIGDYTYDAYEIAEDKDIVDEIIRSMIDDEYVTEVEDWGDSTISEYYEEVDIIVGMAIEEPNGDIHYITKIDDNNGMSDPTELTSDDGIDWIITPHEDGTLTASRKPTTEYYLNIIVIKDGNVKVEELKCLGEDGFNKAIVECVKNGLTMCADTYRTEEVVKAFLLNVKEN